MNTSSFYSKRRKGGKNHRRISFISHDLGRADTWATPPISPFTGRRP